MSQDTLPFSVERSDNGPKFMAEAVREWINPCGAKTVHIDRSNGIDHRLPMPARAFPGISGSPSGAPCAHSRPEKATGSIGCLGLNGIERVAPYALRSGFHHPGTIK
jgi:hypothetical protein